jgi:hypothetical protein
MARLLFCIALVVPLTAATADAGGTDKSAKDLGTLAIVGSAPPTLHPVHKISVFPPILVSLFHEGKIVKTAEVFGADGSVVWKGLRPGVYEIHWEAVGHERVVKTAVVEASGHHGFRADLRPGSGTVILGAGPYLQGIEDRLKKIEETKAK